MLLRVPRLGMSFPGQFFDATPDNQKFIILTPANRTPLDEFTVILNWPSAMKKK